jgi:hypothetical protein
MSQSSGVLLSSLGQGLVQFAGVYGDTKTSSLEAEGQRLKEMRLQEMQANRNTLTDAFRVAEYDSSQERLKIAQEASALSQEKFDYKKTQDTITNEQTRLNNQHHRVPITKYGWVEETELVKDTLTGEQKEKTVSKWKAISAGVAFVDKADNSQGFIIDASGNKSPLGSSEYEATPPPKDKTGKSMPFSEYRRQYEIKHPDIDMSIEGNVAKLRALGTEMGYIFTKEPDTPSPTDDTASPTGDSFSWDDFNEEEVSLRKSEPWYTKQVVPSEPTLADVGKWLVDATKTDNPQDNAMFAKSLGLPIDLVTAAVNQLMPKGSPIVTPILGSKWLMENRGLTVAQLVEMIKGAYTAGEQWQPLSPAVEIPADASVENAPFVSSPDSIPSIPVAPTVASQEEIIPMAARFRNPGGSAISVPPMASGMEESSAQSIPSPVTPAGEIPAFLTQVPPSSGTSYPELMRQMDSNAIHATAGTTSSPVADPQQLPAGEIPSFPDRAGRSKTELVIESWMGAIPRAIVSVMPIEYSQFLKSYPTLKAAREAEANQSGEDKISFTSAWKTVAKWVESQNLDIAPGGGAITEEVLDSAAEASDPATIRGEFGIPPDVNPMPDRTRNPGDTGISVPSTLPPARTFDPSDGMGMNSSLANAGSFPATGGIISAPPTEEQQKNLGILESLRKQGSFGNKVEPEPVNLAPVGQTVSQAPTSPDTSSNKDAKAQVLEIVAAMEQANIGKEVIRKELLRLLELIKPAEAESPYARALAEVYFEFTKESN